MTMNKEYSIESNFDESPVIKKPSNNQLNLSPQAYWKETLFELKPPESTKYSSSSKRRKIIFKHVIQCYFALKQFLTINLKKKYI